MASVSGGRPTLWRSLSEHSPSLAQPSCSASNPRCQRQRHGIEYAEPQTMWTPSLTHFTFAFAFLRSAQYFFIRLDASRRAASDHSRARRPAFLIDRLIARRFRGNANSGKVLSIAITSARSWLSAVSAPALAISRSRSMLKPLCPLGIHPSESSR